MKTTTDVLNQIRAHGRAAYPEEGCGFLLGRAAQDGNHVTVTRRADNEDECNRRRRYTLAPADYRAADEAARAAGLDVVGFYHSHPDHPARPSDTDLAEATFPGYTYVIVAVKSGTPADVTAWTLAPDRSRFLPEPVHTDASVAPAP